MFKTAVEYGKKGRIDITTSSYPYFADEEIKPSRALRILLEEGVPLEHITFSSDACGSLLSFDPVTGDLMKLDRGLLVSNLNELRDAVFQEKIPLEIALRILTQNPAQTFKLPSKGFIREGADADLLIFNKNLELQYVIAQGQLWMEKGKISRSGNYE